MKGPVVRVPEIRLIEPDFNEVRRHLVPIPRTVNPKIKKIQKRIENWQDFYRKEIFGKKNNPKKKFQQEHEKLKEEIQTQGKQFKKMGKKQHEKNELVKTLRLARKSLIRMIALQLALGAELSKTPHAGELKQKNWYTVTHWKRQLEKVSEHLYALGED